MPAFSREEWKHIVDFVRAKPQTKTLLLSRLHLELVVDTLLPHQLIVSAGLHHASVSVHLGCC